MPDPSANLGSRAQTNLQLYTELRASGYPDRALERVGVAHDAAMALFSGAFRGEGRPFLAHLVGTASILGRVRAPIDVLLAGLLHAAYEFGDFGDGTSGVTAAKRARVVAIVGQDVERLIAAFAGFRWNESSIAELAGRSSALAEWERQVVVIRLANLVDELVDSGVLYSGKAEYVTGLLERTERNLLQLAVGIGQPALAAAVERLHAELKSAEILPALRRTRPGSFVLAPESYIPRASVSLRGLPRWLYARVALVWRR